MIDNWRKQDYLSKERRPLWIRQKRSALSQSKGREDCLHK